MIEELKQLLYELTGVDVCTENTLLEFLYNSELQHVLNDCNLNELPKELEYVVIERAIGQFIGLKYKDLLGDEDLNVVTSIKEGDTQVNFDSSSNAGTRLQAISASLLRDRERDMACYRKLKW